MSSAAVNSTQANILSIPAGVGARTVSRAQLRGARAMLAISADALAKKARVHRRSIRAIERNDVEPQRGTLGRIVAALESEGVEFLSDGAVALRNAKKASSSHHRRY